MNIDIIVKVIIPILGAILTYMIVPFIKSKTTKEQRENVYFWIKIAVNAAEQVYKEKGQGKLKKEYVVDYLMDRGIKLTVEELDVLIEAAVLELNIIRRSKALE
ncbi:phage holin, LLH family [Tissierella praeacuta]|uniref:phage holin, LLH family n=1 Tax=Tissierella praeacuta TaxID=43131 RepID=UPI0035178D06